MLFSILTIFPEMFSHVFSKSILKRAIDKKLIKIDLINIRKFANNKHKKVDDAPFGGGAGMVMSPQPIFDCVNAVKQASCILSSKPKKQKTIFLTPQGKIFTQRTAERLAKYNQLILLCGRYEGIDQRIRDTIIDEEISVGKYVLSGGEIPAMVIIDAVARLTPDVVGSAKSLQEESFSHKLKGKKEYPNYTRPAVFRGLKVPEPLLSGNHKEIEKWKKQHLR